MSPITKMSQKEAVFNAVRKVLGNDVSVEAGMDVSRIVTSEQRRLMVDDLVAGFEAGKTTLETEFPSGQALRTYCTGLLSNWLRKDKRLNGGEAYQPKNPGSRQGGGDAQLAALRKLFAQVTDQREKNEIQGYITAREAQLNNERTFKDVNVEALPEGLRTKYAAKLKKHAA